MRTVVDVKPMVQPWFHSVAFDSCPHKGLLSLEYHTRECARVECISDPLKKSSKSRQLLPTDNVASNKNEISDYCREISKNESRNDGSINGDRTVRAMVFIAYIAGNAIGIFAPLTSTLCSTS